MLLTNTISNKNSKLLKTSASKSTKAPIKASRFIAKCWENSKFIDVYDLDTRTYQKLKI